MSVDYRYYVPIDGTDGLVHTLLASDLPSLHPARIRAFIQQTDRLHDNTEHRVTGVAPSGTEVTCLMCLPYSHLVLCRVEEDSTVPEPLGPAPRDDEGSAARSRKTRKTKKARRR